MTEYTNQHIRSWNTFGMDVEAHKVYEVYEEQEIKELLKDERRPFFILGGGSNLLLTRNIEEPVIKMNIKGICTLEEDDRFIILEAGAGEVWHDFVLYCVQHAYWGVENLSLIPGTVGAAPIQNIGAYGVEVKDSIHKVEYIDIASGQTRSLSASDCRFAYRDSIFKNELKGQYIITRVAFRLSKIPQLHTGYGSIGAELEHIKDRPVSIKDISDAVIRIRKSKLPDPAEIGNSGSFFKNPVISAEHFSSLQALYGNMPHYLQQDGVKVPAAFLIEECGWKGYRKDDYGVHQHQALVLVNYGRAKGKDIYALSEAIIASVDKNFRIMLEREVQVY